MTYPPEPPSGANEFAPLENAPHQPDPYAPVDYPATGPTALGHGYPPPPGYPQASAYPPPIPTGYPPPPVPPYGGGYSYADPYNPYAAARPQNSTNGLAIASLVVSLASLVVACGTTSFVGVILGILGMRDAKRTGQEGYGLALAGVIIGAIPTVLWILWLVFFVFFGVLGAASSTT
jgi:uncharacterized protein DUF4190